MESPKNIALLLYVFSSTEIFKSSILNLLSSISSFLALSKRTTTFLSATIVPFDSLALIYNVCWSYTVDDGANPAEQQKFRQLFENRMQELRSNDVSGVYDWNDDTVNQDIYSWR